MVWALKVEGSEGCGEAIGAEAAARERKMRVVASLLGLPLMDLLLLLVLRAACLYRTSRLPQPPCSWRPMQVAVPPASPSRWNESRRGRRPSRCCLGWRKMAMKRLLSSRHGGAWCVQHLEGADPERGGRSSPEGEVFADDGGYAGAENFDGMHPFGGGDGGHSHLERSAGDAAQR